MSFTDLWLADRTAPSIAMASKSFERIFLSRVFDRRKAALRAVDRKILSKHTAAIAIDDSL